MKATVFANKSRPPTDAELGSVLGRTQGYWDRLLNQARAADPGVQLEWKFYSSQRAWTHLVRGKRRNLLYLTPAGKGFTASFAISERALESARRSGLPAAVVELIEQAPKYPEGRAVRVQVKSPAQADIAAAMLALKMAD